MFSKNVAFGAGTTEGKVGKETSPKPASPKKALEKSPSRQESKSDYIRPPAKDDASSTLSDTTSVKEPEGSNLEEALTTRELSPSKHIVTGEEVREGNSETVKTDRKPSEDAISAAKERYLARKRIRTT